MIVIATAWTGFKEASGCRARRLWQSRRVLEGSRAVVARC